MDNNCVLVKKKEYEELKKQANSKKPDYIKVEITGCYSYLTGGFTGITSSINLSGGIMSQINSIRSKIRKLTEENLECARNEYRVLENKYDAYAKMNFWQRIKWAFTSKIK